MKSKIKLVWHESSNTLAIANCESSIPEIHICASENYQGENPFLSYPINWLPYFGWVILGDIK